jgi:hypothetical protein
MERKYYLLEILFAPLVIALVGILGTYFINSKLDESAAKRAQADQQIKILEMFSDKISSNDVLQRQLAIRLLNTLLDKDLAGKIAIAVYDSEPNQSILKKEASQVADASARDLNLPRIFIQIKKEENKSAAQAVRAALRTKGIVVPDIDIVDVVTAASELRYFRKEDEPEAKEIQKLLSDRNVQVSLKDLSGEEIAKKMIHPRRYELWFAPGEPK